MTKNIVITQKASQDLNDCFAYIANDNSEIALRFFDLTRLAIAQIARMPGIGSVFVTDNDRLQGLRKWVVKDFRKYLIFILIVRKLLKSCGLFMQRET